MGYTHGVSRDSEFRKCICCGETFPNTNEYFSKANGDGLSAVCKKCQSIKTKEKNDKLKSRFLDNKIEYDGNKECKKCGRLLPNSYLYFPIDKTSKSGLRNVCRECSPKYSGFLPPDFESTKRWTNEEDEILKENYNSYTGLELKEKFLPDRTVRSIESRASLLGIIGKTEETKSRANAHKAEINREKLTGRIITEEAREKLSKSLKEYYTVHDGWWLGKKRSEEQVRQMSERMKGKWAGDKNPRHINPLNGEANGRWKGGINKTYTELRTETFDWMKQSMEFCNYKCVITGGEFDNIHHNFAFRDIVDLAFWNTMIDIKPQVKDYTKSEFNILRDEIRYIHSYYGYGACLNKDVHKLFHDNYGYTNFNPHDIIDFVDRIKSGEFDEWFKENNYDININEDYILYLSELLEGLDECVI